MAGSRGGFQLPPVSSSVPTPKVTPPVTATPTTTQSATPNLGSTTPPGIVLPPISSPTSGTSSLAGSRVPATGGGGHPVLPPVTTPPVTPPPPTATPGATGGTTGTGGVGGGPTTPTTQYDPYNVLQYDQSTWNNLPVLKYAQGQLGQAQFMTLPGGDLHMFLPGGQGVTLPAPNKLNYAMLQQLQQERPDSYALLNSAYTAANMPLDSFMGGLKALAPIGTASESSLISTV